MDATELLQDPTVVLTCALVARRSVTPDDAGCQELLKHELEALGFVCETLVCNGVTNLWARRGSQPPLVCLAGHTDVVPTGPTSEWHSDPFTPVVRDGVLYGRGAADMKGSIAAFVTAVRDFLARHGNVQGSIAFLVTSDEEGPSVDGTARVVERLRERGERIDYCIIGEPSSVERFGDLIKNGRRGTLSGTLRVKGLQAHIAYPDRGRNPIHLVAPAIAELASTNWDDGNAFFPPTTWQCSNIHAGTGAGNVIPGSLEVMFNFRYSTASTRESLIERFESILRKHALDFTIDWTGHGKPFLTERGRLVEVASNVLREVTGSNPVLSTTGGTSDGRFIADICSEVVELGPIGATIHKIDERVALAELPLLARVYRMMLERLLVP